MTHTIQITDALGNNPLPVNLEGISNLRGLLNYIADQNHLPQPGRSQKLGDLVEINDGEYVIYHPRIGVLNLDQPISEMDMTEWSGSLYFHYFPPTFSIMDNIHLSNGKSLADTSVLIVVEWQNRPYPVILPTRYSPNTGTQTEGPQTSILSQIIFEQIVAIDQQSILPTNWQSRNWRLARKDLGDAIDISNPAFVINENTFHSGEILTLISENVAVQRNDNLLDEISILSTDDDDIPAPESNQEVCLLDDIQIENNQSKIVEGCTIEIVIGNIVRQKGVDAIVNPARRTLDGGGGVDGAIHAAAGPNLVKASKLLSPCETGEAVLTPGFRLPIPWIIHTVGPIYQGGTKDEGERLHEAYFNSLKIASASCFKGIAFPSISTGAYGYPIQQAAQIALQTVIDFIKVKGSLTLVRFVLHSADDAEVYVEILNQLA